MPVYGVICHSYTHSYNLKHPINLNMDWKLDLYLLTLLPKPSVTCVSKLHFNSSSQEQLELSLSIHLLIAFLISRQVRRKKKKSSHFPEMTDSKW